MPKKRYLIVLSLFIICTSVFTGAFCLFTDYKSATLHATTGKWSEDPSLRTAFAIYSADDTSLSFYKRSTVPSVNETFEGKTVTAVYTGIEELAVSKAEAVPWFNDYAKKITSIRVVDTISPCSIAWWFGGTTNCTSYDLKKLDTSNVTSMYYTFYRAGYSTDTLELDLNCWDTSKVQDLSYMFYCAGQNTSKFQLDLSNWDLSSAENLSFMFYCAGEYSADWSVGDLNTKIVTREDGTTYRAWDVSNVSNFQSMFSCVGEGADSFSLDVSDWNISNATVLISMFSAFRRNKEGAMIELDVSTKTVTLEDGYTYTAWDVSNYSGSMFYMFGYLGKMADSVTINLSGWDTSNVTSMKWMFYGTGLNASTLNFIGELSQWNTSNVTDMACMFREAGVNADYFLDLSTKAVTREDGTTYTAWDVSKVTNYGSFCHGVSSKFKLPSFINAVTNSLFLDTPSESSMEADEL